VLAIATGLGFAGTRFMMSGHDLVGVQPTSATWVAASTGVIGVLALLTGALGRPLPTTSPMAGRAPRRRRSGPPPRRSTPTVSSWRCLRLRRSPPVHPLPHGPVVP
jgi:hypothetical protein